MGSSLRDQGLPATRSHGTEKPGQWCAGASGRAPHVTSYLSLTSLPPPHLPSSPQVGPPGILILDVLSPHSEKRAVEDGRADCSERETERPSQGPCRSTEQHRSGSREWIFPLPEPVVSGLGRGAGRRREVGQLARVRCKSPLGTKVPEP